MRVGLCLPVFERSAGAALEVAQRAEVEGLDGVFCFDHLFPAGQPHRPALSAYPVLAAVAVRTTRLRLGPLVSRVGVLEPGVTVTALASLDELSSGRLIAGLGAGDSRSKPESEAFGLPILPVGDRLAQVTMVARAVRSRGIEVWIGGNSERVRDLAGAEADAWNCWNCPASVLADLRPGFGPGGCRTTWAGPPPADGDVDTQLAGLADAGSSWAIYAPPPTIDWPEFVSRLAGAAKLVN